MSAENELFLKEAEIQALRRELEATIRAKQENDERFHLAAEEAREESKELRAINHGLQATVEKQRALLAEKRREITKILASKGKNE